MITLSLDALQRDPFGVVPPYRPAWVVPEKDCRVETLVTGRTYFTPDGAYPSVTTVLATGQDKTWLTDWRERVGAARADAIVGRAQERGTRMHAALEVALDRLQGISPATAAEHDWEALEMAGLIMEELVEGVDYNICVEQPVWSNMLMVAGRVDCVSWMKPNAEHPRGFYCINDFKSSRRIKTKEQIPDYFRQCALYAMCFAERTGIWCEKLRILMSYGDNICAGFLKFEEKTSDWIDAGCDAVQRHYEKWYLSAKDRV